MVYVCCRLLGMIATYFHLLLEVAHVLQCHIQHYTILHQNAHDAILVRCLLQIAAEFSSMTVRLEFVDYQGTLHQGFTVQWSM